jgi:hypothetical protein
MRRERSGPCPAGAGARGASPRAEARRKARYAICEAANSQLTRFQNASTYFGRALR